MRTTSELCRCRLERFKGEQSPPARNGTSIPSTMMINLVVVLPEVPCKHPSPARFWLLHDMNFAPKAGLTLGFWPCPMIHGKWIQRTHRIAPCLTIHWEKIIPEGSRFHYLLIVMFRSWHAPRYKPFISQDAISVQKVTLAFYPEWQSLRPQHQWYPRISHFRTWKFSEDIIFTHECTRFGPLLIGVFMNMILYGVSDFLRI